MAGRDVVGEAIVLLELENRAGDDLARAIAEFKAETAALGREKAEINLRVKTDQAVRDLAKVRAELKALEDIEKLEAGRNKELSAQQKSASTVRLNNIRQEIAATRKSVEASDAEVRALKTKQTVYRNVGAMVNQLNKERAASEREASAAVRETAKAEDEANTAALRRAQTVRKSLDLQKQYIATQQRANELTKALNRAQGSDRQRVQIDQAAALAQMEELRLKLIAMGERPISEKVKIDTSDVSRARQVLRGIGGAFGFNRTDQIRGLANDLQFLAGSALKAHISVGPLRTTIGGLLIGASALAPVILGLVGAIGSLVAVTGAAAGGLGGILGAGALGAGMAGIGIFTSIKPFIAQLGEANSAMQRYSTAVSNFGPHSKQADKAQKELSNTLKTLPPDVRNTVNGFEALKNKWLSLTQAVASRDIGKIIGSTFQTARADMGFFAHDTNTAFTAIANQWSMFMAQLRSSEAKSDINNIFSNFNRSIPNIGAGLRSLADTFGNVFSNFSKYLPSLTKGFAAWANVINQSSSRSNGFANGVRTMVGALRDFGHFAEAATRFLFTFFRAGVRPGEGLLNDMTKALDKVNARMNTVAGQQKLNSFFSQGVKTTKELWNALLPLISAFVRFSNAVAPVTPIALGLVAAFTKLIAVLVGFAPLKYFAGFLIGLAIIGRMTSALREMKSIIFDVGRRLLVAFSTRGALGTIGALKAAFAGVGAGTATGTQIGTTAAAEMEAAAPGIGTTIGETAAAIMDTAGVAGAAEVGAAGAAGTAAEVGAAGAAGAAGSELAPIAGEAAGATAAIAGTAAATEGLGAALAAVALGPVGIAAAAIVGLSFALSLLVGGTDDAAKAQDGLKQSLRGLQGVINTNRAISALPGIRAQGVQPSENLPQDMKNVNDLQAQYNSLIRQGKTGTQQFRDVQIQLNDALLTQRNDQAALNNSVDQARNLHERAAKAIKTDVTTAQHGLNKAQRAYNDLVKQAKDDLFINNLSDRKKALKDVQLAQEALTLAQQKALNAQYRLEADNVNAARVAAGMITVTDSQALSVGRLADQIKAVGGTTAQKAFRFIVHLPNPADIQHISNMINSLSPKDKTSAINVLANTQTAEQAIQAINALQIKEKVFSVSVKVGDALAALAQLRGIQLPPKTLHLLHAGDPAVINTVAHIKGLNIPPKTLRLLGDAADAIAKHNEVGALNDLRKTLTILGDATPALNAFNAVQNTVHNITSWVTTVFQTRGHPFSGAAGNIIHHVNAPPSPTHGALSVPDAARPIAGRLGAIGGLFANGGLSENPILREKQIRAAMLASMKPTKRSLPGGIYDKPTYLVGEENRREYVIATNPAYKTSNVKFLKQAAHEFGYRLIAAAKGFNSVYGLPPRDRIGGVGVSDIQSAVDNAQQVYNNYHNNINNQRNNAGKTIPPSNRQKRQDRSNLNKLNQLQSLLGQANSYIQQFQNLETDITTVNSYLTAAENSTSNRSTGYDPSNGRLVTYTWSQWKNSLIKLENYHTSLLKKAAADARTRVGRNANATNLSYVKQLEQALGQSIVDQQNATGLMESPPAQPTLDQLVQELGRTKQLQGLNYAMALAQINNVEDIPGTPQREDLASLKDDLSAAHNLVSFYTSLLGSAQKTGNLSLMTDAATALIDAQNTYRQLNDQFTAAATSVGPSQQMLADQARAAVLTGFGSNMETVLGLPASNDNASVHTALAQSVINTLRGPLAPNIARSSETMSPQKIVNVTNNYQQPPEDPHLWSQGLSWELEAAL